MFTVKHRLKMRQDIYYDAEVTDISNIQHSFAIICPEIYVDYVRTHYWRQQDIDFIEESLGIFILLTMI